jgi:hypothetical protein
MIIRPEDMLTAKLKHLEFIQNIITRMANNSFLLKGWTVTLIVAIFALENKSIGKNLVLLSILPIVIFWLLDAYFLRQERLYRKLYKKVAENEQADNTFSLNTRLYNSEIGCIFKVAFSLTLFLFYVIPFLFFIIAYFIF